MPGYHKTDIIYQLKFVKASKTVLTHSLPFAGVEGSVMLGVPIFLGTAGACMLVVVVVVVFVTRRLPVVFSLAFDKINDPGSPDKGVSSMNSSPYRERRFMASIRVRVSWYDVSLVFPVVLVEVAVVKDVFAEP